MSPWNPSQWTETFLESLIGQSESMVLEFKSSRALVSKADLQPFIREQVSPTLSGFANSSGGILIIGISEDRMVTPRVAKSIEGILFGKDQAVTSVEQFERVVSSCITPAVPGLRVRSVPVSTQGIAQNVLVIYVPAGHTAHQASDYLYYGRSEFETKPLPDQIVRLLMSRAQAGRARLELAGTTVLSALDEWSKRQKVLQDVERRRTAGETVLFGRGIPSREALESPPRIVDEHTFQFAVSNPGERTLHDFVLVLRFQTELEITFKDLQVGNVRAIDPSESVRFRFEAEPFLYGQLTSRKIFPGDLVPFPASTFTVKVPTGAVDTPQLKVDWTFYLDDGPPSSGQLDLPLAVSARTSKDET